MEKSNVKKLWDGAVCYGGRRVAEWMKYKAMSQPSNAIQFTYNPKPSHDILFCCVAPHHLVPEGFSGVWWDLSVDGHKWSSAYGEGHDDDICELNPDHVFLWPMKMSKNHARTRNSAKASCEFFLQYWDDEEEDIDPIKVHVEACGVHIMYYSESEWKSDLEVEEGRRRKRDGDEEGVPPTGLELE